MSKDIKCIFSVARSEYVKWITNPRVIVVGVLLVFMKTLAIEPLLERADKIEEKIDVLEPFAAIGNSGMLVMLIPCVFMVLISDYPKMTGNTLYFVKRTGKKNWFIGQMLFVFFAIISFLTVILLGSVLMSQGSFTGNWSDVVTKYNAMFPDESGNFTSQLLPSNLYNQIPLITSILQTIGLMTVYMLVISMIIYFFKLIHIQFDELLHLFIFRRDSVVCSKLERGNVYCYCPYTATKREMAFDGYDKKRDTLSYKCPAKAYGIECKGCEECPVKTKVRIKRERISVKNKKEQEA